MMLSATPDSLSGAVDEFHPFQCCAGCVCFKRALATREKLFLINLCSPVDPHLNVSKCTSWIRCIQSFCYACFPLAWHEVLLSSVSICLHRPANLPSTYITLIYFAVSSGDVSLN